VTADWDGYATALADLSAARRAVAAGHRGAQERRAGRRARVHELAGDLQAQQARLADLAGRLRAPLDAADLTPEPAPPLPWAEAAKDAEARLRAADAALAEAERVARLPQLLPQWSGDFGRAAVVYLALTVPNVVLVSMLSVAGVKGSTAAAFWFIVGWPLLTAIAGSLIIERVSIPRLPPDDDHLAVRAALVRRRSPRRYPWFGVLVAWAGWLIPGWLLDQLAALTTPG
jgi:hypothetical protein